MSDYSACVNKECPQRKTCGRYLMAWGEWQSVADFPSSDYSCYWPVEWAVWDCVTFKEAEDRSCTTQESS